MENDSDTIPIETRPYEPQTDEPFIFHSWLSSFRSSRFAGCVPNHLYWDVYRVAIEQLIARGAKILVATVPGKPNLLMGFLCHETLRNGEVVVHYCYVKDPYRKSNIATRLIEEIRTDHEKPIFYTFRTENARHFKRIRAVYAPEIARRR